MRQSPRGRWETIASNGAPHRGATTAIRLFSELTAPKICPWFCGLAAPRLGSEGGG